ncbi:MAG: UDP-N-acetylglucosamine 2-epimerase (non-hydrolyzing) [Paludibacteraceae bacterium]|nr:UDP-N-acetylglucosamine 2-epimerase (non-hydrolyzing) [Paludibacteraceae bacterium]
MHITLIAGARPNFMKIAPIIRAIEQAVARGAALQYRLVHTGQHYDQKMSQTFFDELGIPTPDVNLGCGGGSQAQQTSAIMTAFEQDMAAHPTDWVVVVGDVTSTLACSIVAKKMGVKVAHVEAGIRSFDLSMPEEINRMVTDALADEFFTTSETANQNLRHQGVAEERIHFVGNVMIDTLLQNRSRLRAPEVWKMLGLSAKNYLVMTMHRPANVDDLGKLRQFIDAIVSGSRGLPILFPIHPRTAKVMAEAGIRYPNLHIIEPLGYLEFNYLVAYAKAVLTDSGGITEETTVMHVPCLTLRDNTERPETCTVGTNRLIGTHPAAIAPAMQDLFDGKWPEGGIPQLWDGHAAERIVTCFCQMHR